MNTIYCILALLLLLVNPAAAQWTTYNTTNSPLHSNAVREVALAADGSKWIATQRAIQKLTGNMWTTYPAANGPAFANVMCVAVGNGVVWVGSEQGLSRFDGTSWTTFNSQTQLPTGGYGPNDLTITDIIMGQNGTVWLAGSRGIAKFDGTTWTKFNSSNSGLREEAVTALALDEAANTLWIGTNCNSANSGVYSLNTLNSTWRYFNLAGNNCVHGVAVSASGTVFVGTCNSSGLLTINPAGTTSAVTASSCVALDGVATDPTNPHRAWVASETMNTTNNLPKGLLVYDGMAVVQQFNTANSPLPSNLVSSVVLEQAGGRLRAWVGTADEGLALYETVATAVRTGQAPIAVEVFPNPAATDVEIRTALAHYDLAVYDNAGRLLHTRHVTQGGPVRLPLQDWPSGLYYVRLTSASGTGYVRFSKEQQP